MRLSTFIEICNARSLSLSFPDSERKGTDNEDVWLGIGITREVLVVFICGILRKVDLLESF